MRDFHRSRKDSYWIAPQNGFCAASFLWCGLWLDVEACVSGGRQHLGLSPIDEVSVFWMDQRPRRRSLGRHTKALSLRSRAVNAMWAGMGNRLVQVKCNNCCGNSMPRCCSSRQIYLSSRQVLERSPAPWWRVAIRPGLARGGRDWEAEDSG